ncbi:aconitate hydratase [Tilletia horrida]|uniref:Aconitate hydratase n=1 Tax=Tilletia horrida TaxID=155126 RepID=A0AAN6JXD0_9BASI|nr:aconitate hydratase [Tilletia horrida]
MLPPSAVLRRGAVARHSASLSAPLTSSGSSASSNAAARTLATAAASTSDVQPHVHPSRIPPYADLLRALPKVQSILGDRPLTLSEKILYTHLINPEEALAGAGKDPSNVRASRYLGLKIDRLAMQDASAQMALLQFMTCGLPSSAVPASIHCDHLIQAFEGAAADLKRSVASNQEVFDFLESAAAKYGIEFWGPGSGIIHQIVLENYAAPGLLMLGTDSHTPNASGLGCLAIGVGGADAVDAMTATPWELQAPKVLNVHLTGTLSPWLTPKDVILHLASILTVRGGTGHIIEYSGPALETLAATGLATMSNMGAEVGATTSCFPYTERMGTYLTATGRGVVAEQAKAAAAAGLLSADADAPYDRRIEINLSELEPCLNGPFTPDLSTPISKFVDRAKDAANRPHPLELSAALIGSCTNSSYADMARCASLARQATEAGLKVAPHTTFDVTPGSERVRATVTRDGLIEDLERAGARVLANACGPCIGQWDRREAQGEDNVILTSFNRNFKGRNDGNTKTWNMLASPEMVTAMAFAGRLDFNPLTDTITTPEGKEFRFQPPVGEELPPRGFDNGDKNLTPDVMPTPKPEVEVLISPTSARLQHLEPFGTDFTPDSDYELGTGANGMRVLMRLRGKTTTDHISAAGPWLKYKGHLENLAENTLIGATNDQTGRVNSAVDFKSVGGQDAEDTIPAVAKAWKGRNQPWLLIADHNYGEGSAREHAALQPRFFGCRLIVARSVARIAETNLRKQGVLTLLFKDENDYTRVGAGDKVETLGLRALLDPNAPERLSKGDAWDPRDYQVKLRVTKVQPDGTEGETFEIETVHTLSKTHLEWIRAGSALNVTRQQAQAQKAQLSGAAKGAAKGAASSIIDSAKAAAAAVAGIRSFHTYSQGRLTSQSRTMSSQQRRGYASSSNKGAQVLNPNDPRYVAPAADARTEALRNIVYPNQAMIDQQEERRQAEYARLQKKKDVSAVSSSVPAADRHALAVGADVLSYPPEVHDTIVRAYLLQKRQRREELNAELVRRKARMDEAVRDLRETDANLFEAARYRVQMGRRTPEEQRRLIELGIIPSSTSAASKTSASSTAAGGDASAMSPSGVSAETRRIVRAEAAKRRLGGLFPREMRAPTLTPSRKGWQSAHA